MQLQFTVGAIHSAWEVAVQYAKLSQGWQLINPRPPSDKEALFQRLIPIQLRLPDVLY